MKRKLFCIALALILCFATYSVAFAATRQASGYCFMNNSGRNVSFGGYSSSAQTEDTIGVTVILWEKRGTKWYEIARASDQLPNTDYVDASGTKTVEGGHFYKVTGIHTSSKNGTGYSTTSTTAERWIP